MKNNKVNLYYGLMVVLLVLIGISSFFFNYFYNLRDEDLSIENMIINESNKMSYNVKLFDNEFFKREIPPYLHYNNMTIAPSAPRLFRRLKRGRIPRHFCQIDHIQRNFHNISYFLLRDV